MARCLYSIFVGLAVIALASAASVPPESGLATPTDPTPTSDPYAASITAGGAPSMGVIKPPLPGPAISMSTPSSIVIVPPTMPPAVAKFVSKIKAAKAALSASMLPVV